MTPTVKQAENYQALYDYFNQKLFGGALAECILNFSRKTKSHGFFAPERWVGNELVKAHEISLNPDSLERDPEAVCATLVHEMCHLWRWDENQPGRRLYHCKLWAKKMEEVGLIPSHTGEPGGRKTGQNMSHYIDENGPFIRVYNSMPRELYFGYKATPFSEDQKAATKSKNKLKYECSGCDAKVWGKEGMHIICGECEEIFTVEEA